MWYKVEVFDDMSQCTEAEVERMLPFVSEDRREQALRYKHTFGQFCCLKSWLLLEVLLRTCCDLELKEWAWQYNEHGKPYLTGSTNRQPRSMMPFFNISHCKDAIAVVVADEEVGIDVESIRKADDDLIRRVMNSDEMTVVYEGIKRDDRDRIFTRLWTQKEAIVKAQGTGISSFEQLQHIRQQDTLVQTIEKEKYIYSIAHGRLHCFGA